jgi:hypothetical protein
MSRKRMMLMLSVGLVSCLAFIGQGLSQEATTQGNDRASRMEQFRAQMSERMREAMGATPEEWKLLEPRIEKVQTLSRDARVGGMGMMGMTGRGNRGPGAGQPGQPGDASQPNDRGNRGNRGNRGPAAGQPDRPQSEVEKAQSALRTVLEDKAATPEQIKPALEKLRAARAQAQANLEAAQKELREVVTVRQEAQLVASGLLE